MKCNWKEIVSLQFKCMQHWKNEIWKSEKHLNCTKLKCKWNFANFKLKMKSCKIWKCKWKFAKNLKWNWICNSLKTAQRELFWVFDSNEKGFALAKRSQGRGGWVSQKELTSCNFQSNFRNYSLSQMPSDGKLIASQFRFRIRAGLVLTKHFLCVLIVPS